MDCNMDSNLQMAPTFEEIWKQDIMPLKGKSLYGYSGHKNIITDVNRMVLLAFQKWEIQYYSD